MMLQVLSQELSVCKVDQIPAEVLATDLFFVGKTDEETSLVCETRIAPTDALEREDGWRAFRVVGVLDFSLIGILAEISGILAQVGVGIFVVSTYNTDYVLVKAADLERATAALGAAGHEVVW